MRVLVVGNASLSDLILKAGAAPTASAVSTLSDSPGRHGAWVPGGAATTIALAVQELGHEVELCHPLSKDVLLRPSLSELSNRQIGLTRCPLVDEEQGRCVIVYTTTGRAAWSTPPDADTEVDVDTVLDGIGYVIVAPVWSGLSASIVGEANRRGIPCAMIGEFAADASEAVWDIVVVDQAQHDAAKGLAARIVAITDGPAGSTLIEGASRFDVPAKQTAVRDTTGAGDTYGGALIGALLAGQNQREAAEYATRMASRCCEGDGSWAAYIGNSATLPATPALTTRDRVLGSVWGTGCGDAFGMPNSFLQNLPWLTKMMPGPANSPYHAGYPAGRITDDTEQAMALTEALLEDFTPPVIAAKLNEWFIGVGGENSLAVGPSTKRAMLAFARGENVLEIGKLGVTNGSAMRVAPIGIVAGLRHLPMEGLIDLVELSCIPTHNTSPAISGAGAIAAAIAAAVEGQSWPEIMDAAVAGAVAGARRGNWIYAPDISERILLARRIAEAATSPAEFTRTISVVVGTGEPCTESVPAALAAAHYAKGDPAFAIELCANSRGDTDTTAAMAGGICGAFMGWQALPEDWRTLVAKVNNVDFALWADKLEKAAHK
jgi:ADP-ribosylglycohydrolase/sugar/nucleoside kinase (ribokinase family)